jgi:hypothetical protein
VADADSRAFPPENGNNICRLVKVKMPQWIVKTLPSWHWCVRLVYNNTGELYTVVLMLDENESACGRGHHNAVRLDPIFSDKMWKFHMQQPKDRVCVCARVVCLSVKSAEQIWIINSTRGKSYRLGVRFYQIWAITLYLWTITGWLWELNCLWSGRYGKLRFNWSHCHW